MRREDECRARPGMCARELLEALYAVHLAKISIESAERQVARLAGNLHNEAIGKAQGRKFAKMFQCGSHDLGVLQAEPLWLRSISIAVPICSAVRS